MTEESLTTGQKIELTQSPVVIEYLHSMNAAPATSADSTTQDVDYDDKDDFS